MTIRNLVLQQLQELGYQAPKKHNKNSEWYTFDYECYPVKYVDLSSDESISIVLPDIDYLDPNDNSFESVLNGLNETSIEFPYVKPTILPDGQLWFTFDQYLFGNLPTKELLKFMIIKLEQAYTSFLNFMDKQYQQNNKI